jgi:polyribonucleotide 5'-hydroxyl-kinase
MKGQSGPRVWTLEGEEELRIEVAKSATFSLLLKEGNAEIFGVELPENAEVNFTGVKLAVFTWYGCVLETKGDAQVAYQSHETPMNYFVNTHVQLEGMREAALAKFEPSRGVNPVGPRVLVCGPPDSGKSRFDCILCRKQLTLFRALSLACVPLPPSLSFQYLQYFELLCRAPCP